jgi:protein phosphatase
MSPTDTTAEPGLLEHPREAFGYFQSNGVEKVVCEEKHMGSRAVVIACRSEEAALKRFGVANEGNGIIYTRTGRRFFEDRQLEAELLAHIHRALTASDYWKEFESDWFCLDCELMPWSAKAQELLQNQYAAVGSAGLAALTEVIPSLKVASARYASVGSDRMSSILQNNEQRLDRVTKYVEAYRRYCWTVRSVNDLKLAPFHLLASHGHVHADRDHLWHMQTLSRLATAVSEGPFMTTSYRLVELNDPASVEQGIKWWEDLTARGGEGMVIKPLEFAVRGKRGLVQPAVKCRGREYLRIIYGPEYDTPENLERLKQRSVGAKRSLALREFALGFEGLERFVRSEPLRRVHECVFGVLALESEPVDPRL